MRSDRLLNRRRFTVTGIGGDHDGVAAGTFCEDTTGGKTVCGVGCSKHLSANAIVDCALVHTQNLATLGSRMCLAHLRWRPALTHLAQEPVSLEHHLTWKDLHTEDHETHQAD